MEIPATQMQHRKGEGFAVTRHLGGELDLTYGQRQCP